MPKQPIPYETIKEIVQGIPDLQTKALVACQYGTAARIGEIVPYSTREGYVKANGEVTEKKTFNGLAKKDFLPREHYIQIWLVNLKNVGVTEKRIPPIILNSEKWLLHPISEWIKCMPGETLFPFPEWVARSRIKKATGFSSHYLRHSRITHWIEKFKIHPIQAAYMAGHSQIQTTLTYVTLSSKTLAETMQKNFEG